MSHTYGCNYIHVVYGTKHRAPSITEVFRSRLWRYVAGIGRTNDFKVMEVGGTEDPIHALLSLPPTLPISKAVQLIKGGSSKWVHDTFPEHSEFGWQEGFGYFSVSLSNVPAVIHYIQTQPEHHRKMSFEEEWKALLAKHGLSEYQPSREPGLEVRGASATQR